MSPLRHPRLPRRVRPWLALLAGLLPLLALLLNGPVARAQTAPAYPPTGYRWSFATNPSNGNGLLQLASLATGPTGSMYVGGCTKAATTVNGSTFPAPPDLPDGQEYYEAIGFVGKLSAAGGWQWLIPIGNATCAARVEKIVTDAAGRVYATGTMRGTFVFSQTTTLACEGDLGAFVICYDANGAFQWATQAHYDDIVSTTHTYGVELAVCPNGNTIDVFVVGQFNGRARFGTGAIELTTPYRHEHTFVGKLSGATGAWQWVRQAGTTDAAATVATSSYLFPRGLGVDAAGNAYFAAQYRTNALPTATTTGAAGPFSFRTDQSLLVGKISSAGAWVWLKAESNFQGYFRDLVVSPDGQHAALVGQTGSGSNVLASNGSITVYSGYPYGFDQAGLALGTLPPVPNNATFVASLSAAGAWEWVAQPLQTNYPGSARSAYDGSIQDDQRSLLTGVRYSPAGEVFVNGTFQHPTQMGPRAYPTGTTSVVARLQADGNLLDSQPLGGTIKDLGFDPSGNMLAGGTFTSVGTTNGLLMRSAIVAPPTITSFTPTQGPVGTVVTITGTNFENVLAVRINGAAAYIVNSTTQITATLAATAGVVDVEVQTASGTAVRGLFTIIAQPAVASFSPTFGSVGTRVTVRGVNFFATTSVKFNGTSTSNFTVVSNDELTVTVPAGASTGKVSITNPAGTGISAANFGVGIAPVISSITPNRGAAGSTFSISGAALGGATSVKIGTVGCQILSNSATTITARVPNTLMGAVIVTTPYGTATGPFFQPTAPAPAITFFAPASGPAGTTVTIAGSNLDWVSGATVSGAPAAITAQTATSLTLTVPDVASGRIALAGPGGTATSVVDFVVPTPPAPAWAWAKTSTGSSIYLQFVSSLATDAQGNTYVAGTFGGQAIFGGTTLYASGTQDGFVAKQRPDGTWAWAARLGGYGDDAATALTVLPGGRLVVVGWFNDEMTVGTTTVSSAGQADVFVAFLNLDGTGRTVFRGGSAAYDLATAVCAQPDGTVWVAGDAGIGYGAGTAVAFGPAAFAGRGSADVFLARLTEATGFTSVCHAGGTNTDHAAGVAVSATGKLVVVGSFYTNFSVFSNYLRTAAGGTDAFVIETSITLAARGSWGYELLSTTSPGDDAATAVAFDPNGRLVVAGTFQGTIYTAEMRLAGLPPVTSAGSTDGFLFRMDLNYVPTDFRRFGGAGADAVRGLIVDASDNITVAGTYETTTTFGPTVLTARTGNGTPRDMFVARLTPAGQWSWAASAGTTHTYDDVRALTLDAAGNAVIAGTIPAGNIPAVFGALPPLSTLTGLLTAKLGTATVPAPTITGLTPTSGPRGTMVTVTGTNLATVNDIEFLGGPDFVNYQDISAISNTALTFAVPAGATTGPIRVTTASGTAQTPGSFTVTGPTNIVFSPATGRPGTLVTILGTGFANVTAVRFGGVALPAANYTVVSGTTIRAYVDAASLTGLVSVVTAVGTGASAGTFTVISPPTITGFSPLSGPVGSTVTITGTNFTSITRMRLGSEDVDAYTVVSPTSITVVVPDSVPSGQFSVEAGGTVTASFGTVFTVTQPVPTISSFAPGSGPTGTTVTITGTAFTNVSEVRFNNVACPAGTWTALSATSIVANVPATATTGRVRVTTPSGLVVSAADFTVTSPPAPPTLTGFTPASGPVGTSVTLTGTNLTGATAVAFNGTTATFTVNTATQITTSVPAGATDGPISVTTPGGSASSAGSYDVTTPSGSGWPTSVTSSGNSQAMATVTDAAGNVYVAGFFNGTASFGSLSATSATQAGFVVKYNSGGVAQWVRAIGNAGQVQINGLDLDANGAVYLAGTFTDPFTYSQGALPNPNGTTQRGFVGQLAPNGVIQFLTGFGSAQPTEVRDVVVDLSGVIYVGGMFQQVLSFDLNPQLNLVGSGASDGYVAALNTGAGQWSWATRCGGSGTDDLTGLAIDLNGQALYACGTFENGSFNLSGTTPINNQGSVDLWVARLSTSGVGVWTKSGASNSADYARDVAVSAQGTVYVAVIGFATGTLGSNTLTPTNASGYVAVARLSPSGSWLTGVAVAGGGTSASFFNYVSAARLAVATDGAATLTGFGAGQTLFGATTLPAGDGSTYAIAARTTTAGTGWQWAQALTDGAAANQSYGAAVALRPATSDAYVVGTFTGSLTLDGTTLTSGGFVNNAFAARVSAPAGPPAAPTVTTLSPNSGPTGTSVTFTGTNLTGTTVVSFNGAAATSFTVNSATQLTATVPAAATSGPVSVTTPGGSVSGPAFGVTASTPVITSFSPASGPAGTSVTLSGQHLALATEVRFNGTLAAITGNTATLLTCTVPVGATDGPISVTTSGGTGTSATPFDVTGALVNTPVISAISPTHAPEGAQVTITGQHLTTATQVRFNGVPASFYVSGPNLIAQVPVNASSGIIAVTTPVDDAGSPDPLQLDLLVLSNQTVGFASYYDVTVAPGATLTLGGAGLEVQHAMTVQSSGALDFNGGVIFGNGSFTAQSNTTLTIRQAEGLTLAPATQGDVQVLGTRSYASDADYVYAGGAQVTGAALPANVRNLTVQSGNVTLTNALGIKRVLKLASAGNLLLNNRMLTLLSDAAGTAMLVNGGAGRVIGTSTVERFITADVAPGIGYRQLSSPVQATTVADLAVAGANGFTPIVNPAYNTIPAPTLPAAQFPNVLGFDETRGGPTTLNFTTGYFSPAALTTVLTPGRGYSVAMRPVKPDFVGDLTQNELTVTNLTRTGTPLATGDKPGFHLLGNPYASPLDWDLVPVPAGLSAAIFVWKTQGGTNGVYLTRTNGIGSLPDGLLPMGQGFWVQVTGAGPVSLTLPTAARPTTYDNPLHYRPSVDARPQLALALGAVGAAPAARDETFVYAEAGATSFLDNLFDAAKPGHNVGLPTLASLTAADDELAINGLPETALTADAPVPLLLDVPAAGPYELTATTLANLTGTTVTLVDDLSGTRYDLHQQPTVTFAATQAGEIRDRFRLVFGQRPLGTSKLETRNSKLEVWPNPAHGSVRLRGAAPATSVQLLDATGRTVRTLVPHTAEADLSLIGLAPGVYTVRAGSATRRLVVE